MNHKIKYLINGCIAAAIDLAGLYLLHGVFKIDLAISVTFSFVFSFFCNYFGSKFWVFRITNAGKVRKQSLIKFSGLTLANLVIQVAGVTLLESLGLAYLLAKVFLMGLMVLVNYAISKKYIF